MQLQLSGDGIEISAGLKETTEKKFARLNAYQQYITHIHITYHVNKIRQSADAVVNLKGKTISAKAESEDMYKTLDLLVQKIQTQMSKYKEKLTEHE